jgi:mannosyltransferase
LPGIDEIDVIAPHFKRRLSGVTSTVIQLVPRQEQAGVRIATLGPGLPPHLPMIGFFDLLGCWKRPKGGRFRVWHARRNNEMLAGVLLRDLFRMPLKLVFTSAGQRRHTRFTKWLIRRMDAVIATSARSGSFLDVPHSVVMHGIDTTLFHPAEAENDRFSASGLSGTYAVGCTGRVRHQKGTDLFVEAMLDLLPRYPDWTAVVTGWVGPEHQAFAEALKAKITAAGLEHRIVFLGEVEDVKVWYRRFSLFVAPSRNEGFGLTPLEAMASATPVVVSDAGAYAEMVLPGQTGLSVAAGNGAALRDAIEAYLADPDMAARHGAAALVHVRRAFDISREVEGVGRVYAGLLGSDRQSMTADHP